MIKKVVAWLLSISLILGFALALLLTPMGMKTGIYIAKTLVPGTLSIGKIQGDSITDMSLSNVVYQSNTIQFKAKKMSVQWHPMSLLLHKISINNISIYSPSIHLLSPAHHSNPSPSRSSNWNLNILNINLKDLHVFKHRKTLITLMSLSGHVIKSNQYYDVNINGKTSQPLPLALTARIKGPTNNYHFSLNAQDQHLSWLINGHGDLQSVNFSTQKSQLLNGSLAMQGVIKLQQKTWRIQARGKNIDFNELQKRLPKNLNFTLKSQGAYTQSGEFKTVTSGSVHNNGNIATFSFNNQQHLTAHWNVNCKNINTLLPNVDGTILSQGEFTNRSGQIDTHGNIVIRSLSTHDAIMKNFSFKWQLHSANNLPSKFQLQCDKFLSNQWNLAHLKLNATGTPNDHLIRLSSLLNSIKNNILITGRFNKKTQSWAGTFSKMQLVLHHDIMKNTQPLKLQINPQSLTLQHACLIGTDKKIICLNIDNKKKKWLIQFSLKNLPTALLNTIIKLPITVNSRAFSQGSITVSNQRLAQADVKLNLHSGSIAYRENGYIQSVPLRSSQLSLSLHHKILKAKFDTSITAKDSISGWATIENFDFLQTPNAKRPMRAKIITNMQQLKLLQNIIPSIKLLRGQLQSALTISGNMRHPLINGQIHLSNGRITIPLIGVKIDNIDSLIKANRSKLTGKTTVHIGNKSLLFTSNTNLHDHHYLTHASLTGENVLIYNSPQYVIHASPKLSIILSTQAIHITGNLYIPQAIISPITDIDTISLPHDDIVYTSQGTATPLSVPVYINVHASSSHDVTIKTGKITAKAIAVMQITKQPNKPFYGNGNVSVTHGTYQAYGHTLVISPNSALLFSNSPIYRPNLSIRASKAIQTTSQSDTQGILQNKIIVGVKATGTINKPHLTLFSIPANLSQSQILSFLLLGYAIDTGSADNKNFINALSALKLAQSGLSQSKIGDITGTIRSSLGLSELNINTQTQLDALGNVIDSKPSTAFVIGKYFTKHIYLRYLRDINSITPANTIQAKIILNRNWSLQASSTTSAAPSTTKVNTSNAVDLLYTVNKN